MAKKTVEDIQVNGKRVLVRCDFNVPLDPNQNITDDNRIIGALPTIEYLLKNNAKVILCSHLGRPKGEYEEKYSLKPVAKDLSKKLGREVKLSPEVIGEKTTALVNAMKDGDVVLLENLRFRNEEKKNDSEFAKQLASLADIYVNDAFGTAHRAHASTEGVTHYLPAVAGYLIGKELDIMGKALEDPARPFVAILGGAKVSDKIGVITNLLEKVTAERKEIREMLLRRAKAFEEEAQKTELEMLPYDGGFFISIPCEDPKKAATELEKYGIFIVPLAMGLRVSVASVSEKNCRKMPAKIAEVLKQQ